MVTNFSANRKALDIFQDTRVQLGMSEKKEKLASKVYEAIGGFLLTRIQVAVKEIGKIERSSSSSNIDFYDRSQMMINTMSSIRMSYPNLCQQESLEALRLALANKKIFISFYGDSNVGKSTVLNAIMGDRYLPVNRQTETALSVEIQFRDHRGDSPYEAGQDDVLEVERDVLATGAKGIKEKLQELNKTSREESKRMFPKEVLIKLQRPCVFTTAVGGASISLVDTPGCNEYDSGIISHNIKSAENFSSAFIFVTSFDTYRDGKFSTILKEIYSKHPDIIKQNRLTIVINKMDDALSSEYDESSYSTEDVIEIVRNYFCKTIFNISPLKMPNNSVILVCGTWASYARCFKKFQQDWKLQERIEMEAKKLLRIDDFEVTQSYPNLAEDPLDKKAELLEKCSNVKKLEDRLVMMSESSLKIWKLKMASDICDEKNEIISEIEKLTQYTRNANSEWSRTMKKHFKVVESFKDFYLCIHSDHRKTKGSGIKTLMIWKKFKHACDKDITKEFNILTILLNAVSESLEAFKATISDKMSKGLKAEVLEKDLEDLLNSLSQKLDRYMSSQEAFEALSERYHLELMSAHGSCVLLQSELHSIINSEDGSKIMFEGPPKFGHIKLAGPRFCISLNIPLQLSFFQKFLKKFREIFKLAAKSKEEFKFQFSDASKPSLVENGNENLKSTSTQSSLRNEQPDFHDKSTCSEAINVTESTFSLREMSVDLSDDYSSLSSEMKEQSLKSTYSDTRELSTYTKWSSELEDVKIKIQEGVNQEIKKFFEDIDSKVVSIYCRNYYESVIGMLKQLDKSTQEEMNKCIAIVESSMTQIQSYDEGLRLLTDHHQKLNKLWLDYESMMKKIS